MVKIPTFISLGDRLAADPTSVPTQWSPPTPEGFQPYDALGELTDELVRLVNASDLFNEGHRSGDGTVSAVTVDGTPVSIAVVVTQLPG